MSVEKPIPKEPLQQITAGANSAIDRSECIAIKCVVQRAEEFARASCD